MCTCEGLIINRHLNYLSLPKIWTFLAKIFINGQTNLNKMNALCSPFPNIVLIQYRCQICGTLYLDYIKLFTVFTFHRQVHQTYQYQNTFQTWNFHATHKIFHTRDIFLRFPSARQQTPLSLNCSCLSAVFAKEC